MLMTRFVAGMLPVATLVLGAGIVSGQAYPTKSIRIMDGPVGGTSDFFARFYAQGISGPLGQPVLVENRSGVIGGQLVSQAPPDGYTLVLGGASFWIGPLFQKVMPYDPLKDFSPISLTNRAPNVLVVHPSLPVKSVKELIALAKAKPGALNASTSANGSSNHLALEQFKSLAKVNIVRIPYTSGSQEAVDLLSGQMQMTFGTAAEVSMNIKAGKLRALAVSTAQPSALFPELPTIAAAGVPGFESGQMTGVFAPAKTPAPIINRLNQELVRFLRTPAAKEALLARGTEAVGSTPEELGNAIAFEMAKANKLIKDLGLKIE